jgi:signal transduction histidine kinase
VAPTQTRWVVPFSGGFGAIVTLVVVYAPEFTFGYRSPSLHAALETASSLVALLGAYLVLARFRRTAGLTDLGIGFALAYSAAVNLVFGAGSTSFPSIVSDRFAVWAPLGGRFVAGLFLLAAAFLPARPLRKPNRHAVMLAVLGATMFAATAVAVHMAGEHLPKGISKSLSPAAVRPVGVDVFPSILAFQLAGALCLTGAAYGFARRALRTRDDFMNWLAAGCLLGAFARLNYALFPSAFSDWVYTGDALRLGFYVLILIGAARELRRYRQQASSAAMIAERQRLARDLHDGLAQELAFIALASKSLQGDGAWAVDIDDLVAASDRALLESREAIATLARAGGETLAEALADAAHDVAKREGAQVNLRIAPDVELSDEARSTVRRIVREAAVNAVRHGRASNIAVELFQEDGVQLRIRDDGEGMTNGAAENGNGGYGLKSMRQRAEILGGTLHVLSSPGNGTEIVVTFP